MTVKSKKRRLARRRAHAKRLDNRTQKMGTGRFSVRSPDTEGLKQSLLKRTFAPVSTAPLREFTIGDPEAWLATGDVETPSRAKCPQCGFSQKVRKDGTMSRHDVYAGSEGTECAGTGKQWNSG